MTTMTVGSSELSARLLATENITVLRSKVRTASFDIKSRVLTLPQWKELSPVVEQMLIGHEVGHALYTTEEYIAPIEENHKMQDYLNILEDVRIEKLMKRKYPGIRKVMHSGYQELNEKDFFGISKIQDFSEFNLIDRINLYFKAGYDCGVKFTSEEKVFVVEAEKTETIQDVIDLAHKVYGFSKTKALEKQQEQNQSLNSEEQEELELELEMDQFGEETEQEISETEKDDNVDVTEHQAGHSGLSQEEKDKLKQEKLQSEIEESLKSKTEEVFKDKLDSLADTSTVYNYWRLDERQFSSPIVDFKTVLKETVDIEDRIDPQLKSEIDKFKLESSRVVNYLIKEFEMRKSATMYKRATTSKIGSLDMKKVWSYKLQDDLFKRVTSIPKGKNHGMIMLLDWSGSMDKVIQETMKQVINLAMFCQRSQIPYQVFAFTSEYSRRHRRNVYEESKIQQIQHEFISTDMMLGNNINPYFNLLELFSSKMTNVEFNTMVRRFYKPINAWYCDGYTMGGTPLNESLSYLLHYVPHFQKINNVEKLSLITLTDGEGGSLVTSDGTYLQDSSYDYDTHKKIKVINYLRDPVTKKNYLINRLGPTQTEAILRMIKDRYNTTIVGFYVCRNNRYDLSSAIKCNLPGYQGDHTVLIEAMRNKFRSDGFASFSNTGRDDLFIIPQSKLQIEDSDIVVEENQNAKQIARMFSKQMGGKTTSRILLNKFISYVA